MSTRRYSNDTWGCQCKQVVNITKSFVDPPWVTGLKSREWCSLLEVLMKEFDERFELNNGDWFNYCVCPVCDNCLCDWCVGSGKDIKRSEVGSLSLTFSPGYYKVAPR